MTMVKANTENKEIITKTNRKVVTSVSIDLSLEDAIKLKALVGETTNCLHGLHLSLNSALGIGLYCLYQIEAGKAIALKSNADTRIKEKIAQIEANLNF